jgi:hypothetical protein
MLNNKEKEALKFLKCTGALEEEMFQLYHEMAIRTEFPDVKALLVGLAYESLKHSKMVRELSKTLTAADAEAKDCHKELGRVWKEAHTFREQIYIKTRLGSEHLRVFLKDLAELEDLICEKYGVFLQPKVLHFVAAEISKKTPVDLETLKSVFENISSEKENHREILIAVIYYFATRELEREKDYTPVVRYQNPDGWSRPLET